MGDHHVEGDLECAVEAVEHHAEGIADQQQVDMGIKLTRHGRRISGQADDRLAAFARRKIRHGNPFDSGFGAHVSAFPAMLRQVVSCP